MEREFLWIADPHLDHCPGLQKAEFFNDLYNSAVNTVLVGGDISTAYKSQGDMQRMAIENPDKEFKYVLGNHDFWGSDTMEVRRWHDLRQGNNLTYLTMSKPVLISGEDENVKTALIGNDGFADCPYGDELPHLINDTRKMGDFSKEWTAEGLRTIYQNISDLYLDRLQNQISKLDNDIERLLLVTHVPVLTPPHQRGDNPHANGMFFNKRMGEYLKSLPYEVVALVAHTHREQQVVEGNVTQVSYKATYGAPEIHVLNVNELFEIRKRANENV